MGAYSIIRKLACAASLVELVAGAGTVTFVRVSSSLVGVVDFVVSSWLSSRFFVADVGCISRTQFMTSIYFASQCPPKEPEARIYELTALRNARRGTTRLEAMR